MNIAAIDETVPTSPQVSIRLEKKHPLAIRWMHWINFPVLFTMIWSGLLIYWNDSDNAYQHPHRVYRVGIGKLTLFRFFPDWFYKVLHVPYHVTEGLGYHFFFMWIFALNGIAWVLYTWISGEWRLLLPQRRSLVDAIQVTLVDLHLRKGLPPQTKYNGARPYRMQTSKLDTIMRQKDPELLRAVQPLATNETEIGIALLAQQAVSPSLPVRRSALPLSRGITQPGRGTLLSSPRTIAVGSRSMKPCAASC